MTGFFALHVRPLRTHPLRFVLSLSGIAVGIALMIAMIGLFSSMTTAADHLSALASGADIEVSAPNDGGLPAELEAELTEIEGVAAVAPILRSNVLVDGATVLLLGIDQRLGDVAPNFNLRNCLPTRLRGTEGLLLGPNLTDRRSLTLTTPTASRQVRVLGRIDCGAARNINAGAFVAGPLAATEALAGRPGRPDAIAIRAAPGVNRAALTDAIDEIVDGRGFVGSPTLLADQAKKAVGSLQQGASVMVGLALVVGGFCVFNTMSMTALERRRELATLRAIGGHRRALLRGFLTEMALTGLIGSALGVGLGVLAGRQMIGQVPAVIIDTVGVQPTFVLSQGLVLVALTLGTLVTVGAAFLPARRAVSVDPVEAMRSEGPAESPIIEKRASIVAVAVGASLFVGGAVFSIASDNGSVTLAGFATIILGSLIAQYGARAPIAHLAGRIAERFGNSGQLAAASIARAPRRTWATVTAVTVAVITVVAMGGMIENQKSTIVGPFRSMADSDVWVATGDTSVIPVNIRFGHEVREQVAAVDGVADVFGGQAAYTTIGSERVLLEGFEGPSNAPEFAALSEASQRRVLDTTRPPVATITSAFATRQKVDRGDVLTLTTPSGRVRLPIIEVVDVVAPTQSGIVGISLKTLEESYGRIGYTFIEAIGDPGISPETLKRRVAAALKDSPTPAFVSTGQESYLGAKASVSQSTQIIGAMEVAVLLATALALGNALVISVVEREREIGIIRAIGTTRRQLRNMILIESVAIGITGLVVGVAQGLVQHRVGDEAIQALINARIDYSFTFVPLIQVTIAIVLMSLIAALLPAMRAARTNVIETIGYE